MAQLIAGEYDVTLNGVQIHYTVRGKGPLLIAHSGGPGADARDWDDFAKIDDPLSRFVIKIDPLRYIRLFWGILIRCGSVGAGFQE